MKFTQEAQELFDRYLLAVERKLPIQGRQDLKAEIESYLLDKMEDALAESEMAETDEKALEEQLKAIGSPRSVANTFAPSQPLIGGQHDFIFRIIVTMVVPIVMAVVFFAGLLSFAFSGGEKPVLQFLEILNASWTTGIYIIGFAAVVFMVLTRFFPEVNEKINKEFFENEFGEWNIADLPELVEDSDKVTVWEELLGIIFGSFFVVALLLFFDKYAGLWFTNAAGEWVMLPILTDSVRALVPWWAVGTVLGISHAGLLLYQRRRTVLSRWFGILIKLYDLMVLGMLVRIDQFLQFDRALALEKGMGMDGVIAFESLLGKPYFHYFLIFILVVTAIAALVEIGKTILYTAKQAQ